MIYIGTSKAEKADILGNYVKSHDINRVVICGPDAHRFDFDAHWVDWPEIIMYRTFYPLLQQIDQQTLVVCNEILRTQNRNDLTYNCVRHYLAQAGHQLIFQFLPIIDTLQDLMILIDFDTGSRWKMQRFDPVMLDECEIRITPRQVRFVPHEVKADRALHDKYQAEKKRRIEQLGAKDPHTIPRNLHLLGGKLRTAHADPFKWHVGRNNRFKLERLQTYKESEYPNAPYIALDFPHNFIDMRDFISLSEQTEVPVVLTDLKVDHWYLSRYIEWTERMDDAYASLQ